MIKSMNNSALYQPVSNGLAMNQSSANLMEKYQGRTGNTLPGMATNPINSSASKLPAGLPITGSLNNITPQDKTNLMNYFANASLTSGGMEKQNLIRSGIGSTGITGAIMNLFI